MADPTPPIVAAVWLDDRNDYGLARLSSAGDWVLLDCQPERKLTKDEASAVSPAVFHNHPDDPTAQIIDHITNLYTSSMKPESPRFPWL